jgi:hypothetical protein
VALRTAAAPGRGCLVPLITVVAEEVDAVARTAVGAKGEPVGQWSNGDVAPLHHVLLPDHIGCADEVLDCGIFLVACGSTGSHGLLAV